MGLTGPLHNNKDSSKEPTTLSFENVSFLDHIFKYIFNVVTLQIKIFLIL